MKPELKKRWTDALRSGDYEQGSHALHKDNSFCCLGVSCEVFKEDLKLEVTYEVQESGTIRYFYDGKSTFLPPKVVDLLEIRDAGELKWPIRSPRGTSDRFLSVLNDHGLTFIEIADIIDEQF